MQSAGWHLAIIASLHCSLALGQVPGTIPPIKLPPVVPVKPIPGATDAMRAQEPFVEQYVFCNAMQMYQNRRVVWEPVYRDAGASDEELNSYSANLVNYVKEFCGDRPREYWQGALDKIEAFDGLTDRRTAKALGISLEDATSLRLSRLMANIDAFRRECLGGQEAGEFADLLTMAGSLLPATHAPPGLALPRQDLTTTIGKCGPKVKLSSSGGYASLDQRSLSQCISNALAQNASCDSPVASDHGAIIRNESLEVRETGDAERTRRNEKWRLYHRDGATTDVRRLRVTTHVGGEDHTTELRIEETYSRSGELERREHQMSQDGRPVAYDEARATDLFEGPLEPSVGDPSSARERRIIITGERLRVEMPGGFNGVSNVVKHPEGWWERTMVLTPRSSRECRSVNPDSAVPLGLSRTSSDTASGGNPVRAGRLDTFDMIGQCMCTSLGRFGPELAHQYGFSCGPDANSARLDCLLNPRGPADGIRPECIRYLNDDNPGRDTRTALTEWCGRVAQCPPGAGMATISAGGGAMCSCGTGLATPRGSGGSTPGGSRCAAVSCAGGAGAAGADLFRQCCGAPGELPVTVDPTPGSPVPRPPDPGQLPKKPMPEMPKQPLPPK